jgi:hypothetical protein
MGNKRWLGLASLLGATALCGCQSDSATKKQPPFQPAQQNVSWNQGRTAQPQGGAPNTLGAGSNQGLPSGASNFGVNGQGTTQSGWPQNNSASGGLQTGGLPSNATGSNGGLRPIGASNLPTGNSSSNSFPYGNPSPGSPGQGDLRGAPPAPSFPGTTTPTSRTTALPPLNDPPQFQGSAPPMPTTPGMPPSSYPLPQTPYPRP